MKVLTKQEYNEKMDNGLLKLHMYDIVIDEHDAENTYYKIVCVANDVHLYPCEKFETGAVDYEITNERFKKWL